MAVMDPTGGLRDISTLGRSSASLFHEDFSEDESSGRPAAEPLVSQSKPKKPRRRRTGMPTKQGVRKFISKLDYHKLNYRTRLTLRITSMIASGTTLGSIGSVLYTYTSTQAATHEQQGDAANVWPRDIFFDATYVMLAAAVVTFAADLAFFIASIKVNVRKLGTAAHKFSALTITGVCLSMVIAAVALDRKTNRGDTPTLFWVCVAKQQTWNDVEIDFPFLCGEMLAARWALIGTLLLQAMILATIVVDVIYRDGPRKPKPVVGRGYKVVSGWRGVLDRVGL
ncbi:hypothetical protein BZA05DRAFT_403254 [Tricharina praecox]|uniref:uncharacterized protein n=1 Tax=Tricharina praecox TaxID=43433 RepID=UPI0022211957|nr:uncharacterized protein BZA05DRAFT_403254 [Tricharina praecox]KAI5848948.1 hypothetical protein BZA05DRAFT_403254 [Tricharina praecox]